MKLAIIAVILFCLNIILGLVFSFFLINKNREHFSSQRVTLFQKRLLLVFFNVFVVSLLSLISITFAKDYFSFQFSAGGVTLFSQLILFFVIDDLWFYGFHRLLHENKFLFKRIHRIHHLSNKPLPLEFIYTHPLEWLGGSVGIFLACVFIVIFFGSINAYVFCAYTFFRGFHDAMIHVPMESAGGYTPFSSANKAHALHHAKFNGNYASMFGYLDKLFRTEIKSE